MGGLHLAYLWLPVSLGLLALSILGDAITYPQVVHAIGAGAVASMTLIVMIRAILGHGNRAITGTWVDVTLLGLVHLGALLRIIASTMADPMMFYHLGGTLWALGFAIFFLRYGRVVLQARL